MLRLVRRSRASFIAAGAVILAVVAAGGVLAAARPDAREPARDLAPDLVQLSPYSLRGTTVQTARGPSFHLGFGSSVDNRGLGPLVVHGRRPNVAAPLMHADQIVTRSDGSTRRVRRVAVLRYTRSPDHQHWHLLGFETYRLRAADGGLVRRDRKTGFCLGDRYESDALVRNAAKPAKPVWTQECGKNQRALLSLREGISVGYGDDYDPLREGQYVDITGIPAGRYELIHVVNGNRALRETTYANNEASVLIDVSWPRGNDQPPRIDVAKRCGDGRRCVAAR